MWSEDTIVELDAILELCDTTKTTSNELERLEKKHDEPIELRARYAVIAGLFELRSSYDANVQHSIDILLEVSKEDGCKLDPINKQVPKVNVPFFAGVI